MLVETISNPLLNVANLPVIAELAHTVGATVICDNTFASPVLVNPAKFGVDLVMHSTTKYLGGHGDVLGGVDLRQCRTDRRSRQSQPTGRRSDRSIRSMADAARISRPSHLRVRQQSDSANLIAAWLAQHSAVDCVYYPGFSCSPQTAAMFEDDRRGGVVAFEIAGCWPR